MTERFFDLNELDTDFKKDLFLKLYTIPINKSMYETEMIGSHKFYLAVSEYGEWPDQAVYYLGEYGEVTNIEWLDEKAHDMAKIKLTILNYPKYVFKIDPELERMEKIITLSITVEICTIVN